MTRRWAATFAVVATTLAAAANAGAATFYVTPTGSDSASGLAVSSAWRTVGKVSNAPLQPGDIVLFQGGATFAGALLPGQSGTASAPVTFGSFGGGQANIAGGIWFSQKSYLVFDGLQVDAGASPGDLSAIQASASGSGSAGIVVENCTLSHVRIGINSANPNDAGWTIRNTLIQSTRDSGAIILGHNFSFLGNTILDTGLDSSISYGKHGIYAKSPSITISGNVIRRFSADGLSLRYRNAVVQGNTISDGPIGIAWFQQDPSAGSSTVAYNKISNTSSSGIYVSPSDDAGATRESFVIANNTVVGSGGNGIDLNSTSGSLTLANNSIGGAISPAAHIVSPAAAYGEHHNDFSSSAGTAQLNFNGSVSGLAGYRAASGQGTGDLSAAPLLGADFTPGTGSPLVDAGSASVAPLSYAAGCDGAAFHFCGSAPEMGAVETSTTPVPTPSAPLAPPTALTASATTTSVTLLWSPAADPRVTAYALTKDGSSAGTFAATTATVSGLACGTTSSYGLRSVGTDGAFSDPVSLQAATAACTTTPPPPPAPKDTTLPWVLITSPVRSQTVPLLTSVQVDASDASGIANVTFWVDGNIVCVDKSFPYSCAVTLKAGTRTLLVRATDGAGNIAWMSVKVTASAKLAPTAGATGSLAPSQGTAVKSRFTLALRAPAPQVKTVTFTLDGHRVCTDRRRPFACAVSAAAGWHRAASEAAGMSALSARFRVR